MNILLTADLHGKSIRVGKNVDLILVAGDFSKGDLLRKAIFQGGFFEKAKQQVISSANKTLSILSKKHKVVAITGNIEEIAKKEILSLFKKYNIKHKNNGVIDICGLKILSFDFFVEKWWAKKYKPEAKNTYERAARDEKQINACLNKIKKVDCIRIFSFLSLIQLKTQIMPIAEIIIGTGSITINRNTCGASRVKLEGIGANINQEKRRIEILSRLNTLFRSRSKPRKKKGKFTKYISP